MRLVLGVLVVLVVFGIAWLRYAPDKIRWSADISQGNELVRQIETFHRTRGRLPDSLDEVSPYEENRGKLFYERCSGSQYIVWFGTTLGHSMTYSSSDGGWHSLKLLCSSGGSGEMGRADGDQKGRWHQ